MLYRVITWSSRSPDLSPIEHRWDVIVLQLQCYPQSEFKQPNVDPPRATGSNSNPQTDIRYLKRGYRPTPLRVKEDIEDVSSEMGNGG
ncbi:hypothetical protein TNCV_3468741 [Trichonephila clavipes]|nr:hypothetical protein TNCV_3468741 [Trichonephila clavipes]